MSTVYVDTFIEPNDLIVVTPKAVRIGITTTLHVESRDELTRLRDAITAHLGAEPA